VIIDLEGPIDFASAAPGRDALAKMRIRVNQPMLQLEVERMREQSGHVQRVTKADDLQQSIRELDAQIAHAKKRPREEEAAAASAGE
jgi:hypothetical protein